jgi:hypothetical protein
MCSLPFTSSSNLSHMEPVLGISAVHNHLTAAMSALRTSGATPLPVRVPIAVSDDLSGASILRSMLFVPDDSGENSGWLISIERWEGQFSWSRTLMPAAASASSPKPPPKQQHFRRRSSSRGQSAGLGDEASWGVGALAQPMEAASHFHAGLGSDSDAEPAPFSSYGNMQAPSIVHSDYLRTDPYNGCGSLAPRYEPDIRTFLNPRSSSDSLVRPDEACSDVECGPIKDEF